MQKTFTKKNFSYQFLETILSGRLTSTKLIDKWIRKGLPFKNMPTSDDLIMER